jgi:hypothetical protein
MDDEEEVLRTWMLFCTSCNTHRDKTTWVYNNVFNYYSYNHRCECGAGGWMTGGKPKNLIAWEKEQARERDYHDGLEGVV